MTSATVAVLALCCVLITAVAADGKCSAKMLGKLEGCCEMPKLLKGEAFQKCVEGSYSCAAAGGATTKKPTEESKKKQTYPGGPLCLMTCALCYYNVLTANGDVNITAITKRFNEMSDDTWDPIVTKAITNCTEEYNKANLTALNGVAGCKPGPVLFITCVRRFLMLECPTAHLNKNDKQCPAKLSKLKDCNPFSMKIDIASQRARVAKHQAKKAGKKNGKNSKKTTTVPTTTLLG